MEWFRRIRMKQQWPLVGFVLPTVVIGYGVVIPASCIAGVNELTIGFGATVVGACVTYWLGQRAVLADDGGAKCASLTS